MLAQGTHKLPLAIRSGTKLRIAYLTPEFVTEPKFDGGLANYLARLVRSLKDIGHDPEVFVVSEIGGRTTYCGVPVTRCAPPPWLKRGSKLYQRLWWRKGNFHTRIIQNAVTLSIGFRAGDAVQPFDLVEATNFLASGFFVRSLPHRPLVTRISYHGPLWRSQSGDSGSLDGRLSDFIELQALRHSRAIFGPCRRIADNVSAAINRPVSIVHPPIYPSVSPPDEDRSIFEERLKDIKYVLFFGRICVVKGVEELSRAMKPILLDDDQIRLVMVGRPETQRMMDIVLANLGEASRGLIHINRLEHKQLFPVIRGAEFVVLPSRADNMPNACIEAMTLGKVVVGTEGTGFEELLSHGETGFLTESNNPTKLEIAVRQALNLNPQERDRIGERARQSLQKFAPDIVIPAVVQYYEKCRDTAGSR